MSGGDHGPVPGANTGGLPTKPAAATTDAMSAAHVPPGNPPRPSGTHRAVVGFLRLTRAKQPFTGPRVEATVAKQRAKRHARSRPTTPTARAVRGLCTERGKLVGLPVWTLSPALGGTGRVVVAVHGGAYVGDIGWMHWWLYADIVRRSGATLIAPIYPLAPLGTAAVVVPQMADLLSALISTHGAEAIGVVGDSAGAGLAMAAVQELVRRQAATPARLVLISPWLDATVGDPASIDIDDPMLDVCEAPVKVFSVSYSIR